MPTFQNADAAFAACAPLLGFLEPALLLLLLPLLTFGGTAGNSHLVNTHFPGRSLVGGREESGVGGCQIRDSIQQFLVRFKGRYQQVGIAGALIEYLIVSDDLIFRFLDFDQLAELSWLTGFSFTNDFGVRLKHTKKLVCGTCIAFYHSFPSLLHYLLHPRDHL